MRANIELSDEAAVAVANSLFTSAQMLDIWLAALRHVEFTGQVSQEQADLIFDLSTTYGDILLELEDEGTDPESLETEELVAMVADKEAEYKERGVR